MLEREDRRWVLTFICRVVGGSGNERSQEAECNSEVLEEHGEWMRRRFEYDSRGYGSWKEKSRLVAVLLYHFRQAARPDELLTLESMGSRTNAILGTVVR